MLVRVVIGVFITHKCYQILLEHCNYHVLASYGNLVVIFVFAGVLCLLNTFRKQYSVTQSRNLRIEQYVLLYIRA